MMWAKKKALAFKCHYPNVGKIYSCSFWRLHVGNLEPLAPATTEYSWQCTEVHLATAFDSTIDVARHGAEVNRISQRNTAIPSER
jgi:hypothetical protein